MVIEEGKIVYTFYESIRSREKIQLIMEELKNGFSGTLIQKKPSKIRIYLNGELHCVSGYAIKSSRVNRYYLYGLYIKNRKTHRHLAKFVKMGYNKEVIDFLRKQLEN